jgi:hypothetical protein
MITNRSILPVLAALAGTLFSLAAVIELAHEQVSPFEGVLDYLIEGVFVAALAAGAAALWLLRDAGARGPFTLAAAGHAVLLLPAGATFVRGQESLDPLFPLGVLTILLGILAAAVLDVRGRVAPRRAGVLLLAGWIVAFAADTTLGVGIAWLAVSALAGPRLNPTSTRLPSSRTTRGWRPRGRLGRPPARQGR